MARVQPSEKVTRALRSRGFAEADIQTLTEGQAWDLLRANPRARKAAPPRLRVCFTGFGPEERAALEALALAAGHAVTRSVGKSLGFLVRGDNAGPSKLAQAQAQQVRILTAAEYREFVREQSRK
jgi:NAD-dependent DNA ligase